MPQLHLKLILPVISLLITLIGCKSIDDKKVTWNRALEPYTMMSGDVEQSIMIDSMVIAAQVPRNYHQDDSLAATLSKMELKWVSPKEGSIALEFLHGLGYGFALLRKVDGTTYGPSDLMALRELQKKHAVTAGPAIFYESGEVWGILPPHLMVYVKRGTPGGQLDQMFEGAKRSVEIQSDMFYVEYDTAIGYEIIDIGKQFLTRDEVRLVEHPLIVNIDHTLD